MTSKLRAGSSSRRLTSADVARAVGVSESAVSRAFTPGASVAPAKRARILHAAQELGYRPNVMARAVATSRSNVVGLILFNETNRHHPEVLLALSQAFSAIGVRVMLFLLDDDEEIGEVTDHILSYQLDGVIAAAAIPATHLAQLERAQVPVLFYNREGGDGFASVACDHHMSGVVIARYLLDRDHRRFGLVRAKQDSVVGAERMRGVTDELARAGAVIVAEHRGDFAYDHGLEAAMAWAGEGRDDYTAVIAANDMMAIGVKDALVHKLGRRGPDEVEVAGFDAVEPSRWLSHRIASVEQPIERMAKAAATIMAACIRGEQLLERQHLFPGKLQQVMGPAGSTDGSSADDAP